jgi:hypothetical protein
LIEGCKRSPFFMALLLLKIALQSMNCSQSPWFLV